MNVNEHVNTFDDDEVDVSRYIIQSIFTLNTNNENKIGNSCIVI